MCMLIYTSIFINIWIYSVDHSMYRGLTEYRPPLPSTVLYIHLYICIYTGVYFYAYLYICIYTQFCIFIRICIYLYIYIYIYRGLTEYRPPLPSTIMKQWKLKNCLCICICIYNVIIHDFMYIYLCIYIGVSLNIAPLYHQQLHIHASVYIIYI
jgi:hypothetical protein